MRLDNFVSDLGIVKRRTAAKELADGGRIKVNDRKAKPAHKVKIGDIIEITGRQHIKIRVKNIPSKSVPRESRPEYFEVLIKERADDIGI